MPPPLRRKSKPSPLPLPRTLQVYPAPFDVQRYTEELLEAERGQTGNLAFSQVLHPTVGPGKALKAGQDAGRELLHDYDENYLRNAPGILREKLSRFQAVGGPDLNQAVPLPYSPAEPLPPEAYMPGPRRLKPRRMR